VRIIELKDLHYAMLANRCPAGLIISGLEKRESSPRSGAFVLAFVLAAFALGLYLARFGVLAVLVATALSSAASFTYDLMDGSTLTQALLSTLFIAFVVQVGYLIGQVLLLLRE
jgi:hypothetical protein